MGKELATLSLLLCMACSMAQETTIGEIDQLGVHQPRMVDVTDFLVKSEAADVVNKLIFSTPPPSDSLLSGFKVEFTAATPPSKKLRRLLAQCEDDNCTDVDLDNGIYVDPNAPFKVIDFGSQRDFEPINGVVNMTTIVFLINIAGTLPRISFEAFKPLWLNKYNPNGVNNEVSMENYFVNCSYGKTKFNETNEVVNLMNVVMPATGVSFKSKLAYDMSKCQFFEMYAVQEWAEQQYTLMGGDITQFTRRIVITPNYRCGWYGLGSQGCFGKYCYVWVRGDRGQFTSTFFHELGHTMNLQHSSTLTNEYGDCSCAMGCPYDRGCYNAPTGQRAGWNVPIGTYNHDNITAGTWYDFTLPAARLTDKNFVRFPAYYFSYRTRVGYDESIRSSYAQRISIHQYNGTSIFDFWRPIIVGNAGLQLGAIFNDTNTGIVVETLEFGETEGKMKLCRYTETVETNCFDGLDNDCNGLTDDEDPACAGKQPVCGDGVCVGNESSVTCPKDCPAICGDGFCYDVVENFQNCNQDCLESCSVGGTNCIGKYNPGNCIQFCPTVCRDGWCAGNETAQNCPVDCLASCGDGFCDSRRGEDCVTCKCATSRGTWGQNSLADCANYCVTIFGSLPPFCFDFNDQIKHSAGCSYVLDTSNAWCATSRGTWGQNSLGDCASYCVNTFGSQPPFCFDFNDQINHCECSRGTDISQPNNGYNTYTYICADGRRRLSPAAIQRRLERSTENDMVIPYTTNYHVPMSGQLQRHITRHMLEADTDVSKKSVCGNKICEFDENGEACAVDCCPHVTCGDGVCQAYAGEECESCPQDCAGDLEGKSGAPFCCGAYVGCDHDERCTGHLLFGGNAHNCHMHCGAH
eukprot:gene14165-20133_t